VKNTVKNAFEGFNETKLHGLKNIKQEEDGERAPIRVGKRSPRTEEKRKMEGINNCISTC